MINLNNLSISKLTTAAQILLSYDKDGRSGLRTAISDLKIAEDVYRSRVTALLKDALTETPLAESVDPFDQEDNEPEFEPDDSEDDSFYSKFQSRKELEEALKAKLITPREYKMLLKEFSRLGM